MVDLYDAFLALVMILICTSIIIFILQIVKAEQTGYDDGFNDGFDQGYSMGYKKAKQERDHDLSRVIRSA